MRILKFTGGELESNGYLVVSDGGKCCLIDTGYNSENIMETVEKQDLVPELVLLTHHHYDHVDGLVEICRKWNVKAKIGEGDYEPLCAFLGADSDVAETAGDGEEFRMDGILFRCISTPGHTRGGMCIQLPDENIAFTGDTVFSDEIGYTIFEGGSSEDMAQSCSMISTWPADMKIMPGHGGGADIAYVLENNNEFREALEMA